MAVAIAGWALPASAVYYVSHWDFSSDPLGEFDYTGHNDLVNEGNVPIVDGAAVVAYRLSEGLLEVPLEVVLILPRRIRTASPARQQDRPWPPRLVRRSG